MARPDSLSHQDPDVARLIAAEVERQARKIRLIPSENYVSRAVLEATGSVLTNKYSEGYPGKRYYEGNQIIDEVESLAVERAKALFGVDHVSVSPTAVAWETAFDSPAASVQGMTLARFYAEDTASARLFASSLPGDFLGGQEGQLETMYLTNMPAGILTSQGLV